MGRTGAGKTSITLAITKIIDMISGQLLIYDKNVNNYTIHELRSQVSVLPQDPFIFEGTLRENLDPKNQCSEDQLLQAMKLIGLQKIKILGNGLQSKIFYQGNNLSKGEQ